jgi:hypothetical protein
MLFYKLAIGARFEFRGRQFEKLAVSMARDADRIGHIFPAGSEVTPIGEPLLLSEAEAERWKPPEYHWTAFMPRGPLKKG